MINEFKGTFKEISWNRELGVFLFIERLKPVALEMYNLGITVKFCETFRHVQPHFQIRNTELNWNKNNIASPSFVLSWVHTQLTYHLNHHLWQNNITLFRRKQFKQIIWTHFLVTAAERLSESDYPKGNYACGFKYCHFIFKQHVFHLKPKPCPGTSTQF